MIAGFDLATRFGVTWGRGDTLPRVAAFELSSARGEVGAFLSEFGFWLARFLTEVEPQLVAYEAPAPAPNNPPATTLKLQGLCGVLLLTCHRRGIPTEGFAPSTLKKALAGNGRAKKPEMMAAARRYGVRPETHDAADSFAAWLHAIRKHRPEHAARWDLTQLSRAA